MEVLACSLAIQIIHSRQSEVIKSNKAEKITFSLKAWTDCRMPLRVIKVASKHKIKGKGARETTQSLNLLLYLAATKLCIAAMAINHGRSDAFSTGSHAQ